MPALPSFFILKMLNIHVLLEQALPFENKQIMWHLHHLGFWTFGQLYSLVCPSVGVLSLLDGNCRELGTTLLGILPDGYSV